MIEIVIPSTLRIGGKDYTVERNSVLAIRGLEGEHISSQCRLCITDKEDRHIDDLRATFLHEVVHAIDGIYCGGCDDAMTEVKVNGMAEGLLQFLKELGIRLIFEGEE
ncbi:MAG: hypothetical protein KKD44_26895 [Proteobacteria bacterium]|nr:hypothetical protein [Pseudomonadota bacterium]